MKTNPRFIFRSKDTAIPQSLVRLFFGMMGVLISIGSTGNLVAQETASVTAIETYAAAMEETDPDKRIREFNRAEQMFRQIIQGTDSRPAVSNPDLWVNLGNAAMQGERLGPAIVAFRQALDLDPSNAKARQNLRYARSVLPDWIRADDQAGLSDSLFFWTEQISQRSLATAASLCFAFAVLLFVIGTQRQLPLVRNIAVLPLLLWLVLLGSLLSASWRTSSGDTVIVGEAMLYSADSENSPPRVSKPLPSGAEVEMSQERDRWVEVRLPSGVTGWVLKSKTNRIQPSG